MRIFQADNSLTVDFLENRCTFHSHHSVAASGDRNVETEYEMKRLPKDSNQSDPLKMELECFEKIIRENGKPPVSLEDAVHSLQTAFTISDKIKHVVF